MPRPKVPDSEDEELSELEKKILRKKQKKKRVVSKYKPSRRGKG